MSEAKPVEAIRYSEVLAATPPPPPLAFATNFNIRVMYHMRVQPIGWGMEEKRMGNEIAPFGCILSKFQWLKVFLFKKMHG